MFTLTSTKTEASYCANFFRSEDYDVLSAVNKSHSSLPAYKKFAIEILII